MITVVVPAYNEEKNIANCLKALENQTIPRDQYEIIVVDGASEDRTVDIASQYADKVIQQVSEGVGGARNDGVKIAKYDIIATTDADCEPMKDWLESIYIQFRENDIVAISGSLEPFDFSNMRKVEQYVYKGLFEASNWILVVASVFGYFHLCGANSAFDRNIFMEIGGYMPLAYADDIELFTRINKKGQVQFDKNMQILYSVRRIKKIGLVKYILLIIRMDWDIMILGLRPTTGNYAKQTYD